MAMDIVTTAISTKVAHPAISFVDSVYASRARTEAIKATSRLYHAFGSAEWSPAPDDRTSIENVPVQWDCLSDVYTGL